MNRRKPIRIASLAALLAASALVPASQMMAAEPRVDPRAPVIQVVGSDASSRFVSLGVGKSVVIDLPADIKDVLVADPKIANAVVRSSRRAYIIGAALGQTNVFFFDAEGRQMAGFDIAVKRDLNGIREAIRQVLPGADIRIEAIGNDGIILAGTADTQADAQQAFDIATRLVNAGTNPTSIEGSRVVNAIKVKGRDQVMIKVTVAEVKREVIKQLGIDMSATFNSGTTVLDFLSNNPFSTIGQTLSNSNALVRFGDVAALVRGMERAGVARMLAEPNLTVISGETGLFVAGGEFPIPNGLSCDTTRSPPICQQQIDFKKFGVQLSFTPIVLAEGRISVKVGTEVSDLSSENAITLTVPGTNQSLTIPSIKARRAETVVEVPSGGTLAMAGMIQESTKQQINGVPGLQQIPILGTLFRSRDYLNSQTELVIMATPYIVRAVAQKDLSRPDDGYADAYDPSTVLLGRLNRIYGLPGKVDPKAVYKGNVGFILD
jgi:pilus assembly protein CpaC